MRNKSWTPISPDDLTMPWSGRRIRAVERPCATCGEPFLSPATMDRKYCSQACYHSRPRAAVRTCERCSQPLKPTSRAAKYCSHACASEAKRGPRTDRWKDQRMLTAKGHPIAPPSGLVAYARLVLYDKIGPGTHSCQWCGAPVMWKFGLAKGALIADHLDWDRNNDAPENLVPSCRSCNAHRTSAGTRKLIDDDELAMIWGGKRTRAVQRYCTICATPFLTIPAEVKKGRGRFCSRSCARRGDAQARVGAK